MIITKYTQCNYIVKHYQVLMPLKEDQVSKKRFSSFAKATAGHSNVIQ